MPRFDLSTPFGQGANADASIGGVGIIGGRSQRSEVVFVLFVVFVVSVLFVVFVLFTRDYASVRLRCAGSATIWGHWGARLCLLLGGTVVPFTEGHGCAFY